MWKPGETPHRPERVNITFKIDLKKKKIHSPLHQNTSIRKKYLIVCVYTTMYVFMFKYMWAHINNNKGARVPSDKGREEEDRMGIAVAMWEINTKHWGQETEAEATKQI